MASSKSILGAVAGLAFVGLLLGIAWQSQRALEIGLPPRDEVAQTRNEAFVRAQEWAAANGGEVVAVLGTGSMAPHIPAAPEGVDPLSYVAAYVVLETGGTWSGIAKGRPCVYRPVWAKGGRVLHGAAQRDGGGWIMSGLANPRSESWERMTPEKFDGIAARTFVWRQ